MTEKKAPDWERIEEDCQRILASRQYPRFIESDIVRLFREGVSCKRFDERLPMSESDTIVYEMPFKFGRADIVIFHIDGSASVIEVKDGSKGYGHVVSGIGQAGLYAAQLLMASSVLTKIRKCLLWTSAGSTDLDFIIECVCEQAGVVALPWQSTAQLASMQMAIQECFGV